MALKVQMTLQEMVAEVLAGLNLGVQGEENADLHPLIKRMLRQAQAYLWNHFHWLQNRTSVSIPLVEAITVYDIPDNFEPGSITRVYVRQAGTSSIIEWDLFCGISPDDRTMAATLATSPYNPYRYDIRDGVINILPAPSSVPGTMHIEMDSGLSLLTDENDRPAVDAEACIQLATIYVKEQRRMPVGPMERSSHLEYVNDLRPKQTEGKVFTLGTNYLHPNDLARSYRRTGRYYDDLDYWRGGP